MQCSHRFCRIVLTVICWLALLLAGAARAAQVTTPLNIDYALLSRLLEERVFVGANRTATVFSDASGCNRLTLSDPTVSAAQQGQIRVVSRARVRVGTPLGQRCMLPLEWSGSMEMLEQAYITDDGTTMRFRVVDSRLEADADGVAAAPTVVWGWVSDRALPRMESLQIDLSTGLYAIDSLLRHSVPSLSAVPAAAGPLVRFDGVEARTDRLVVHMLLNLPDAPLSTPPPQTALSPEELAQWDAAWQAWDGFATWTIKSLAASASPELTVALGEALLEARYELRDALTDDVQGDAVVRALFLKTWDRLAPLLAHAPSELPGAQALQLASFISAGDALRSLDTAAPYLGVRIDRDGLRMLARLLSPNVTPEQLDYGTEVDPVLRSLLGLDPELEQEAVNSTRPFDWLISAAHAGQLDAELIQKLTHWVPKTGDLEHYLSTVNALLEAVIAAEQAKGKVPPAYQDIYRYLLLATAWKETCWRQFIENEGRIDTLRSKGGAVGLMQVSQHVWRGIYDVDRLNNDIGYNALAGNEILVHYLVDVALRKKEHEHSGEAYNLARATYAAYNGGPGQLTRYRDPTVSARARSVDEAFWKRYQAIGAEGYLAVRQCYGG